MAFKGFTKRLGFAVVASAFTAAFQHGYNLDIVYDNQMPIRYWIGKTMAHRNDMRDEEAISTHTNNEKEDASFYDNIDSAFSDEIGIIMKYVIVAFYVGGMVGNAFIGVVANRLGRKRGLLFTNVFVLLTVVCMSSSKAASRYELLILGRFLIGLTVGLNCGLCLMYLTEIAPVNLRGAVGSMYMVFFALTKLINLLVSITPPNTWPIRLALPIVPAIFQIMTLPFCPESPKYLLFTKERESEAQTSLSWLRGTPDVQEEMVAMKTEFEAIKLMPKGITRNMITKRELRMPLIIAVHVMVAQVWSGASIADYYLASIMWSAELNADLSSLLSGVMMIIMTVLSVYLVEKVGRRKLLMVGYAGMALAAALLAVLMEYMYLSKIYAYLCVVLVVVYIIMFGCGPNLIPWFNQSARPTASALVLFIYWNACASFHLSAGSLLFDLQTYIFWVFAGLNAEFFLFIYLKAPETKNKPIQEICVMFKPKSKQRRENRMN